MEEELKDYYERELKRLRLHADAFFAEQPFRALAARLGHRPNMEYRDPFVEWLLEGYAFLGARVRRRLDAEFPRFTQALLSIVHPQLTAPTPSMAVARFAMRPDPARLASGTLMPRGSRLVMSARGARGAPKTTRRMHFTTGRPVRLWPVEVETARYLPDAAAVRAAGASRGAPAAVQLTLALTPPDATLEGWGADTLDLFLRDTEDAAATLFEALAFASARCEASGGGAPPAAIDVTPLGFDGVAPIAPMGDESAPDPRDALLPYDSRSFDGWRMLHEFFALPARFQFLRLSGLRKALAGRSGSRVTLLFLLDRPFSGLVGRVGAPGLLTNCAPVVNLFPQKADNTVVEPRRVEHPVLPDRGDPTGLEAHSVVAARGVTTDDESVTFQPFFAVDRLGLRGETGRRFFHAHRRPRKRPALREEREGGLEDYVGADLVISLVDEQARPVPAYLKALSVDLLCTNRHLPYLAALNAGGAQTLTSEMDGGWKAIEVVAGPSAPRDGLPEGRRLWDAVSALSLNYLSLVDEGGEGGGAAALRQMLRLHAADGDVAARGLIDALTGVSSRPVSRRVPPPYDRAGERAAPMAFARGLEVSLVLEEKGGRAALLTALLHRILAGHADANSFVETVLLGPDRKSERIRMGALAGVRRAL